MMKNSLRTRASGSAIKRTIAALGAIMMGGALVCAPSATYAGEQPADDWKVVVGDEVYDPSEIQPQASSCSSKMNSQTIRYSAQLDYATDGSGLVPGVSRIRCGNEDWGLRHIDAGHGDGGDHGWRNIVNKYPIGGTWEDFMAFSFEAIVGDPSYATYRESNDVYRYTAPVKIINKGEVVRTYHPLVVVAADSYNVITSYPRK